MQFGKLPLQLHVIVVRAGDVACPSGAGPAPVGALIHGGQRLWMLAHAEVVIGAPDDHLAAAMLAIMRRHGKAASLPRKIGENAVAAFTPELMELVKEEVFVIHE